MFKSFMIAILVASAGFVAAPPVDAQRGRTISKPAPQKTVTQVTRAKRDAITARRKTFNEKTRNMNDVIDMMTKSPSLTQEPGARKVLAKVANEHAAAKKALNAAQRETLRDFASRKGIEMIPNPPSGPLPPLPPGSRERPVGRETTLAPPRSGPVGVGGNPVNPRDIGTSRGTRPPGPQVATAQGTAAAALLLRPRPAMRTEKRARPGGARHVTFAPGTKP